MEQQKRYQDFLINQDFLSFQLVNQLFVLSFENNGDKKSYTRHYLALVEIKDYHVMIDGRNFFELPIKKWFNNIG